MDSSDPKRRLDYSIIGNLALTIFELVAGLLSNSIAVLSLALHDFSDVFTFILSRLAVSKADEAPTKQMTFGYYRATILAALINSVILLFLTLYLAYNGLMHVLYPSVVNGSLVSLAGIFGLIVNGAIAYQLWKGGEDLNLRSAFWHEASDALSSLAVLVVGIVTLYVHWTPIDGLVTLLVSAFLLKNVWKVINEALDIVMEATPKHVNLDEIKNAIEKITGTNSVHDLHAWTLNSSNHCLSAHVQVKNTDLNSLAKTNAKIKRTLAQKFKINHVTLEMECTNCQIKSF